MDPASAAAMSDPDRNPHFRRRWREQRPSLPWPRVWETPAPPADSNDRRLPVERWDNLPLKDPSR